MLNIVLLCQSGVSTGVSAEWIETAAAKRDEEVVVDAYNSSRVGGVIDGAGVILLGPRTRFQKAAPEKEYANKGIPFTVTDTQTYGMLSGDGTYSDAKARAEGYNKGQRKGYVEKLANRIERIPTPFGAKPQNVTLMQAVSESLQATLPILTAGPFAILIFSSDVEPWQGTVKPIPGLVLVCQRTTFFTSGGFTLLMLTASVQLYCKEIETKGYTSCITLTAAVFLVLFEVIDGNIVSNVLDMRGMVLTLFVGILVPKSVKTLIDRNARIRMPSSIPKLVEEGSMILPPVCIICIATSVVNYFFTLLGYPGFQTFSYSTTQIPFQGIGLSLGGFVFTSCLGALVVQPGLYVSIILAFTQPLALTIGATNLEVWSSGKTPPNVIEYSFMQGARSGGDANLLLPCLIALIFRKSKRPKNVAGLSIVPAVFCIGGSILFGFSMMSNPVMLIPMILSTIITYTIYYAGIVSGMAGQFIDVVFPWATPPILSVALSSPAPLRAIIIQLAAMTVGILIYYPFIKGYDNQLVERKKQTEQIISEQILEKERKDGARY